MSTPSSADTTPMTWPEQPSEPSPPTQATPADTGWTLELLDRQRRIARRVRVAQWPISLGRGYAADVQVDDPHMAALHVRVQPAAADDTGLQAEDLGTLNGVRRLQTGDGHSGKRETGTLAIASGEWLETGRTRWRLIRTDTPVAPERALTLRAQVPVWLCAAAAVVAVLVVLWDTWFAAVEGFKPLKLLSPALVSVGLLLTWSGIWALLARVLHGPPQFMQHLGWAGVVTVASVAVVWVADSLAFVLDWPWLSTWHRPLWIIIMAVVLLGHLSIIFGAPGRRSWWLVGGLCAGSLALSFAETWQTQRQWMPESFMTTIRPAGWQAVQPQPLDALIQRAEADRQRLDALRSHDSDADDEEP